MQPATLRRPYSHDFRPMPQEDRGLSLAPVDNGWTFGSQYDNTSDAGDRAYRERCDEIRTRQWRELDASTVGDVAHDERMAKCLREGRAPAEVGKLLMDLVHERIEDIVRRAAS